jgi:hypothetical protein
MQKKLSIKQILVSNKNWWHFYDKHKSNIRSAILIAIVKLLSCKHSVRGYHKYCCSNPNCYHVKYISHTCKCKACSSCGKKATEVWIQKQNQTLPQTSWQHITFAMPSELWNFFWYNRKLLTLISAIAAQYIKNITRKKHITPGIFVAIHTFGRDMKRNVHIHLSVTTGGITKDNKWKKCFFHQNTLMRMWRFQIIDLFRKTYQQKSLVIPSAIRKQLSHIYTFNSFLNFLYKKTWIVYCSKPSDNYKQNLNYLGRYIKRPAIAESKLKHYDCNNLTFKYLDHNTKTYRNFKSSIDQFITRFIQHIPDVGFRMIRYYGFLANRVRGNLLPIVYFILGQQSSTHTDNISFAGLLKQNFNVDPFACIICGSKLKLTEVCFGNARNYNLLNNHRNLALSKKF